MKLRFKLYGVGEVCSRWLSCHRIAIVVKFVVCLLSLGAVTVVSETFLPSLWSLCDTPSLILWSRRRSWAWLPSKMFSFLGILGKLWWLVCRTGAWLPSEVFSWACFVVEVSLCRQSNVVRRIKKIVLNWTVAVKLKWTLVVRQSSHNFLVNFPMLMTTDKKQVSYISHQSLL